MKRLRNIVLAVLMLAGSVVAFAAATESPASASTTSTPFNLSTSPSTTSNGVDYTFTGVLRYGSPDLVFSFSEPVSLHFSINSLQCVTSAANREAVTMPAGTVADVLNPRHATSTDPTTGELTVFGTAGVGNTDASSFSYPGRTTSYTLKSTGGRGDCGQGMLNITVTSYQADLQVTKAAPARVSPGGAVSWTLGVRNAGPDSSDGWTVTDTLPVGTTGVTTTPDGVCNTAGLVVTCSGPSLAVNGTQAITINATAPVRALGSTLSNSASVEGVNQDPNPDNDSATADSLVSYPPGLCRGTPLTLLSGRVKSANDPTDPCVEDNSKLANLTLTLGGAIAANPLLAPLVPTINVKALTAGTKGNQYGQVTLATSSITSATISIPGLAIRVGALEAIAAAQHPDRCSNPNGLAGGSEISQLIINGSIIPLTDQPITIPLVVGNLYLNQKVLTGGDTITQRAFFLDLPGTALDVILGEAVAGVRC